MTPIKVKIGWWEQRCGNVVRIVGGTGDFDRPWRCACGSTYPNNGRFCNSKEAAHGLDLVYYIGEKIWVAKLQ